MKIFDNLQYTENHEWVLLEPNFAIVGVTDYAQSELGDILGISHAQIGYFEKGKSVPSILQLYKLKRELNITDLEMSDLFKDITYYGKVLKKKRLSSRT